MISTVYNYYLTTYSGKNNLVNNNAHKKSELRQVYNNILRISRKSPLYKIKLDEGVRKYAIDLKESAYALKDVADSLDADSLFGSRNKKASSSNEEKIGARYLGNEAGSEDSDFDIQVSHLATPQINTGNFLSQNKLSIPKGEYSFDINIDDYSYELQFKINDSDSNRVLQDRLARLINRSDIGITAEVIESRHGNSALQLTSQTTGVAFKSQIFSIDDNPENPGSIVNYLGLNQMTTEPSSARFLLNGIEKTSSTNTFTINKGFEITLHDTTGDDTVHIGFKQDFDSLMDSLNDLSSRYNYIVDMASGNSAGNGDASRLIREIHHIAKMHKSSLESAGLSFEKNGHLKVDNALVSQTVNDGSIKDSLKKITAFKNDLSRVADNITINPMHYVNKIMISYPNPVRSFSNPYVTSIYTGMMFNGYI